MPKTNVFPQRDSDYSLMPEPLKHGSGLAFVTLLLFLLLLASIVASMFIGDVDIDATTIGDALFHYDANLTPHVLIRDGRLPRTLANVLVGASLAVAGAIMQSVTRNPLASPSIMGLNTGASFLSLLAIVYVPWLGRPQLMIVSMLGAGCGVMMVYGIASLSRGGLTPVRLALTGIAVSAFLGAIGNGVVIYWEIGQDMLIWQSQGTANTQWLSIGLFSPLAAVGILGAFLLAPTLSVLSLGEHVAQGLGQRTKMAKMMASVIVLILAGGANAIAGPVGFVGLMVPHVVRYIVGHNYRLVIPGAALGGAMLTIVADIIARLATTPFKASVPVSVVTALLGVPFFLYLACRRAKSGRARGGRL